MDERKNRHVLDVVQTLLIEVFFLFLVWSFVYCCLFD
jgi:hypothetical protein